MKAALLLCIVVGILVGGIQTAAAAPEGRMAPGGKVVPLVTPTGPLVETLIPFSFLLGRWEAAGGGSAIKSSGRFSFEAVAEGHAIIRHNTTETAGRLHEDILMIYPEPGRGGAPDSCRALYVDNEGHTIHYAAGASADSAGAVFLSDETPGMPRFRLTYRMQADGTVAIIFEMAPPGSTEFKTYLEGTGRRAADK
jgi:hypothetical protein